MPELGEVKRKIAELEIKGDTDKAIEELKKAVKDFPKEGSLFNKLGDLYLKVKKQKEALEAYEKGARVFKDETYYPNAIALCKKILRLDKEYSEVYLLLGELHKGLDQRGEAANYLLEYADRKFKSKNLEVALTTYTTIKELVPNNPKILQTISAIYEQMGKKGEAGELLKEAKRLEGEHGKLKETITPKETPPQKPEAKVVEEKVKEPKPAAIKEEIKAVEEEEIFVETPREGPPVEVTISPEVADLVKDEPREVVEEEVSAEKPVEELSEIDRSIELGELYCSLGSEDEAVDCFRNAADEAYEKEDYDKALSLNRRIADLRPFDLKSRQYLIEIAKIKGDKDLQVKAMLELAETLKRRDKKGEAQSLYKKILTIDPENVVANEMLAVFEHAPDFVDLGEVLRSELEQEKKISVPHSIDELISEFRREIFESIGEGDHRSHYDLGVAYKGMGLYQEAIEEFEIAGKDENLKLKSTEMIGSCFIEREAPGDAVKVLNEALKIVNRPEREYFGIHFLLGESYEKQNKLTQAMKSYVNAYNIDKTVPDLIKKINAVKTKLTKELTKKGRRAAKIADAEIEAEKINQKKSKITYL